MEDAKAERIREIAVDCLSGTWLRDNGDGTFTCELFADYRDEMSNETAIKIITNPDPLAYFHERLSDWYFDPEARLAETSDKLKAQKEIDRLSAELHDKNMEVMELKAKLYDMMVKEEDK